MSGRRKSRGRSMGVAALAAVLLVAPAAAVIATGTVLAQNDEDAPTRRGRGGAAGTTERVKIPDPPNILTSPIILPGPGAGVPVREPSQPISGKKTRGIIDVLEGQKGGERETTGEPSRGKARPGIDYIPSAKDGAQPGIDYIPSAEGGGTGAKTASRGGNGGTGKGTGASVPVRLSYSEDSKAGAGTAGTPGRGKRSSSCDDVVGLGPRMSCVAKRIGGAGGGGGGGTAGTSGEESEKLTASLDVTIAAVLEVSDDGKTYRVRLNVGAPSVTVPDDMDPTSKRQAESDAAIVMARLRKWTKTLNPEEVKHLKEKGSRVLRLRTPFQGLRKLRLGGPVKVAVSIAEEEMDVVLKFVRASEGGFSPIDGKLKFGEEFFLEATFKEEPKETLKLVRLFYNDLPGTLIQVERTGGDKKIYRSKGYHLMDVGRGTR